MKPSYMIAIMFIAAGCGAAENPVTREKVVSEAAAMAELTQRRADYVDALKVGDGQAVASFWSADAKVREPGVKLDGNTAIAKYASDFFAKGKVEHLDIRPENVFVHDDVAYEFGAFDESGTVGTTQFEYKNYYVLKWQREQNGEWKMTALIAGPRELN